MPKKIIFKHNKSIGTIILNNPKKLNAFEFDMIKELDVILTKIEKSNLKVIIIKGAGKSFCAGGDISWERSVGNLSKKEAKKQIIFIQNTFSKIEKLPQVFIAVIQGYAVGGGSELAMACDIRIALPKAKFKHPEVSLGTIALLGATKRLPRLVGLGKAKYILFTGTTIDSKTALSWGLVDFLVSEKEINIFLNEIISKIKNYPLKVLHATKKSVSSEYINDLHDKFEMDSYISFSRSIENKAILEKFLNKK